MLKSDALQQLVSAIDCKMQALPLPEGNLWQSPVAVPQPSKSWEEEEEEVDADMMDLD